jgi:hypothetical protein
MNRTLIAVLVAMLAASACAELPDSLRGPFAHAARGATIQNDAATQANEARPFPAATDQGKF